MNEFKQIAEELKFIRKANPRKPVPLSLRERILSALETSTVSRDDAANILGIHPMTFYKWQRKMARSAKKQFTPKKAVGRPKKSPPIDNSFIEVPRSVQLPPLSSLSSSATLKPLVEIELGNGKILRIFI